MKYWILFLLAGFATITCQNVEKTYLPEPTAIHRDMSLAPFFHGVASGDPDQQSIVIWTRITPSDTLEQPTAKWEVADDENFTKVVKEGTIRTNAARDFTCKVLVDGLAPGRHYFYRFIHDDVASPVGRTKTAATEAEQLRFAVASCSNYEWGYFNAYRAIANELDLDAVLHLGDYIYEYGIGYYGDTTIGRLNIPPHEILSLNDYRSRYSLYRLDPDLQAAHQFHPFISVWDDHEITNNAYKTGAQNHQEDEGDYMTRKEIAKQVYYEWMPIREDVPHYRNFSFGNLADLIMLDERYIGRSAPADSLSDPKYTDADRTMLGREQYDWFTGALRSSPATWKLIGNQVIFSRVNHASGWRNLDAWDGYPVEQKKIGDFIQQNGVENVLFLTGDTHASWAFEVSHNPLQNYNSETGGIAIEFGTTSINSGNRDESNPVDSVMVMESRLLDPRYNPHLKYNNLRDHGYLAVTLTSQSAQAQFIYVNTLRSRSDQNFVGKVFRVNAGQAKLEEVH